MGDGAGSARQNLADGLQIVVPVYNEGENARVLAQSLSMSGVSFDSLTFVYDFDEDTTLPVITDLARSDPRIKAERNHFGCGVIHALRWAFSHVRSGPVVVLMGDNSDKLSILPEMLELWQGGAVIVSPSRYMRGGKQHGGGFVKRGLSQAAGVSLKFFGFPTSDPTNNFKLYDGDWLRDQTIESTGGFEIALELCYKAYVQGRVIVELPTEWFDRTMGESRFNMRRWIPLYLKWYGKCLRALVARPLSALSSLILVACIFLSVSSCVTPPESIAPRVISPSELELISSMKRGTDYAAGGRMDLAELHLRRAMARNPNLPVLQNDLGFVLAQQGRDDEAEVLFRRALEQAPQNLRARDNYARVLYRKGEYAAALEQYQLLLNSFYSIWGGVADQKSGSDFAPKDLVSVYRNMALVSFALGEIDEAVCYSRFAAALGDASYDLANHARFLLGIEQLVLARSSLREYVASKQGDVAPEVLLDYGMVLYEEGNLDLAKEALTRVSGSSAADHSTKLVSRVLRILIASQQGDMVEREATEEALLEEEGDLCESSPVRSYWPDSLKKEFTAELTQLCSEPSSLGAEAESVSEAENPEDKPEESNDKAISS